MSGNDHTVAWQPCYSSAVEATAHVVRGYLEQFGVPCIVRCRRSGLEMLFVGSLGETEVLVHEDWAHIARSLIRGREAESRRLTSILRWVR